MWDFKPIQKAMGWCTAQWKMLLFCVKMIVEESCKFELARLKKRGKKNILAISRLWFGTFAFQHQLVCCLS